MATALGGATNETVTDLHKALLAKQEEEADVPRSQSEPFGDLHASADALEESRALKAPGGFRRSFLHAQAEALGRPLHERPAFWQTDLASMLHYSRGVAPLGICLDEDGEELPPLAGESGTAQTVLALSKSFVGSGVTFLPGAFIQGGWAFSSVVLAVIAFCNAYCIHLLIACSSRTGLGDFGEIADRAAGPAARRAVHISLVVSQMGTTVAYMIFISQMAESLGASAAFSKEQLFTVIVLVLIPLCYLRAIHKMEVAILCADALIVFGLAAVLWYASDHLLDSGLAPSLSAFRPETCGLFIGTAVFTFEGIPFMLPIRSSMREPDNFWPLFVKVFAAVVLLFISFGLIGYVSYGQDVKAVVLLNLPAREPVAASVRAAYMIALTLGSPLAFLPAAHITELWIFGVVKPKGSKRWQKNALRTIEVCLMGVVGLYGGKHFETFLAFVGALCSAPVAFIYPAWFHLRLCAENWSQKAIDCFFVLLGVAAAAFVVFQTAM